MTEQQIRAAADEIAKEFYPHDTKAVWRPSLAETAERVIRRHATPEAVAMPKCLDCGAETKVHKHDGNGDLLYVACDAAIDDGQDKYSCHTSGKVCSTKSEAIAAYARLCVRDAKPADETKPPGPKFDLPDCCLCGKPPIKQSANNLYCCSAMTVSECPITGEYTHEQWRKLHAPNRLTLNRRFYGGRTELWPVIYAPTNKITALHISAANAEYEVRPLPGVKHDKIADDTPIFVKVTVKP